MIDTMVEGLRQMPALDLALFMLAAFLGAFVAGVAGFAFGLVASAIWLHAISPIQSVVLVAAFAIVVQSRSAWRVRHHLRWSHVAPFVIGGAIGIPIGGEILRLVSPQTMRGILGGFIILFCIHTIAKPDLGRARRWLLLDGIVGVVGGIVGTLTGLSGIVVNIWTMLQGLPRDEQRAVFQTSAIVLFTLTLGWLGWLGLVPKATGGLFLLGLPLVLLGAWLGDGLYGKLDDVQFRRIVIGLLIVSGLVLLPSAFR